MKRLTLLQKQSLEKRITDILNKLLVKSALSDVYVATQKVNVVIHSNQCLYRVPVRIGKREETVAIRLICIEDIPSLEHTCSMLELGGINYIDKLESGDYYDDTTGVVYVDSRYHVKAKDCFDFSFLTPKDRKELNQVAMFAFELVLKHQEDDGRARIFNVHNHTPMADVALSLADKGECTVWEYSPRSTGSDIVTCLFYLESIPRKKKKVVAKRR